MAITAIQKNTATQPDNGSDDPPLRLFYDRLREHNAVQGLPDDFERFESALQDTNRRRAFFERLQGSSSVKGLPDDFERFNRLWGAEVEVKAEVEVESTPLPRQAGDSPQGEMLRPTSKEEPDEGVLRQSVEEFGKGIVRGLANIPQSVAELMSIGAPNPMTRMQSQQISDAIKLYVDEPMAMDTDIQNAELSDSFENPAKFIPWLAGSVGEATPSMIPGMGTAKLLQGASRGAQIAGAALASFPLEAGAQLEEAKEVRAEQGKQLTNSDKALAIGTGLLAAGVEGVADVSLLRYISNAVNKSGLGDAAKQKVKKEIGEELAKLSYRSVATEGAKGFGTEAATEGVQQIIANTGAKYGWEPGRDVLDHIGESMVVGGFTGGPVTGVGAGVNVARAKAKDKVKAEGTIQEQEIRPEILFSFNPDATPAEQLEQLGREANRLFEERQRAADAGASELVADYDAALDRVAEVKGEVENTQSAEGEAQRDDGPTPPSGEGTPPGEGTITVSEGRFEVTKPAAVSGQQSEGTFIEIRDVESGEPLSRQSKFFNPAFAEYLVGQDTPLRQGFEGQAGSRLQDEATGTPLPASRTSPEGENAASSFGNVKQYLEAVANEGTNPMELIEAHEDTEMLRETEAESDTRDVMRTELGKIRRQDIDRVMGSDFLTENQILNTRTSEDATPLDVQAEIIGNQLNREVTEQELIEFALNDLRQGSEFTALRDRIKERFREVTGVGLTPSLIREVQQRQTQEFLDDSGSITEESRYLIDNYIDDQGRIDYTTLWEQELKDDSGKSFFTEFPGSLDENEYQRLKDEVAEKTEVRSQKSEETAANEAGQTNAEGTQEADESETIVEAEDEVKAEVKDEGSLGSPSRFSSTGGYSEDIGRTGTNPAQSEITIVDNNGVERPVRLGNLDKINGLAMPELVRMVKELAGDVPGISTRFRTSRGRFYPVDDGKIALAADIFEDTQMATKVLAHEIGHLIDYLPEQTMSRGNLLGRLKSLRRFLKTTAEGSESTGPALTTKERRSIRNRATQDVVSDEGVTLSEYIQNKEIRTRLSEQIKERYQRYIKQEIADRKLLENKELFEELFAHSKQWRPFDEENVTASYLQYRRSSEELYADALSALLTSPGTLEENAPTFYNEFFAQLDNKPQVKATYLETQAWLNGGDNAVRAIRDEDVELSAQKAEEKTKQLIEEREKAGQSLVSRLRQDLEDRWHPIIKKFREAEKAGKYIPPGKDPRYFLQDLDYKDNAATTYLFDVNKEVVQPIEENGLSTMDLHKYLLFNRIANEGVEGDAGTASVQDELEKDFREKTNKELDEQRKQYGRSFMANPGGLTADVAQEQLDFMREKMGEDKYALLEQSARRFQELNFAQVEEAVEAGTYNRKLFETLIEPNKYNYATFRVIDYIEYPDYVNAAVKASKGTFKEVGSTFDATLLKTLSLINLNQVQKAKLSFRDTWLDLFPEEIEKAQRAGPGRFQKPPDKGQVTILEDGKTAAYNVDPYIAEAFDFTPKEVFKSVVDIVRWTNESIYRPMFITYNPAFVFWSNPNRDFKRMYKNLPEASLGEVIKGYIDSWQDAKDYSKGNLDNPRLRRLVDEFAIAPPGEGLIFKERGDALGRQMERFHLLDGDKNWAQKQIEKHKATKWIPKLLSWIRMKGSHIEILPKLAADRVLEDKGVSKKERSYRIRNYFGTPNFKAGGIHKRTSNSLYMFSNIFIQGYKADMQIAKNPETRGAFWFRTAMIDILPKLLIRGAILGWFGDELKEFYDRVTEYDKTNYVTIPLGFSVGGSTGEKANYLRIPQDESGRLISSMMWKLTGVLAEDPNNDLHQVFDLGADELPSPSPFLQTLGKWGTFMSGKNPTDDWRDRPILPKRVQDARKVTEGPAVKKMVEWTINQTGLTSIATYDTNADNTTELILQTAPILNRMIKSTDYGMLEQQNAERDMELAVKQAERLNYGEDVLNLVGKTYYLQRLGDRRTTQQELQYRYLNNYYHQVYKPMDELIRMEREEANDASAEKLIEDLQELGRMYEEMMDEEMMDEE